MSRARKLTAQQIITFQRLVYRYYRTHKRDLPWRRTRDPYAILVSEVMLQQTQVDRVIPKYEAWLKKFPDFEHVARASVSRVLSAWQGLGYNRRAAALKHCAEVVVTRHAGELPDDITKLILLPGIGPYTAAAITAFTYNQPAVFIETNIRSVYIHHFFRHKDTVADADILPLLVQTLDIRQPRQWYSALMDYGSAIKRIYGNPNRRSKHYVKQKKFEGSDRQVRGKVLRLLLDRERSASFLAKATEVSLGRIGKIVGGLERDGLIRQTKRGYVICD